VEFEPRGPEGANLDLARLEWILGQELEVRYQIRGKILFAERRD